MKILILSGGHVHELLGYRECAGVMREALAQRAAGLIQQPLRTVVRPRDAAGLMATMAAAALFADSRESVTHESGDYLLAADDGMVNPVRAELGEVITGTAPGRPGDDEITVFESLGLAAEDLAAARFVYDKAIGLGAGTAAEF